jgi:hypothetical protein
MTLRQDELIKRLPDNNYNIAKTAREVGYSQQSSRAGTLYASLRKRLEKLYSPESIKAKIVKAERKFIKDGDNSNLQANLALQAKIIGLTKDNNAQQVQVNINDTIAKLRQPIDISQDNTNT